MHVNHLEILLKYRLDSCSEWGLEFCLSDKLPDEDPTAAHKGPPFKWQKFRILTFLTFCALVCSVDSLLLLLNIVDLQCVGLWYSVK